MPTIRQLLVAASLLLSYDHGFALADDSSVCSADSPCAQGCCSTSGNCGFGPAFCGAGNCTSSCDAVAECGQYAAIPGTTCPLNVCCSQYGYCGTTTDFCTDGCQSGCSNITKPSCSESGDSALAKTIGYYESWAYTRPCDAWTPTDINATSWTHLNYAFALVSEDTYEIEQMNDYDDDFYSQFVGLKDENPSLKVFISIGGWDAGGAVFSNMSATSAGRSSFISSVEDLLETYGFDGVDIDWEYPGAADRDGNEVDFANYVTLLTELRSALGSSYGITITLPSSYWYLQHFDIVNLEPLVDWFNVMTYDLHGTWDGPSDDSAAVVEAHSNLTEIDAALDLLWRNDIDSSKVVLGLGYYGRSFTLSDPNCTAPGCPFSGGGEPGECTQTSGILSDAEIQRIIASGQTPILDETDAVEYLVWNETQWVSYDDSQTFEMKIEYANGLCLSGTMAWAVDLAGSGAGNATGTDTGSGSSTSPTGSFVSAPTETVSGTTSECYEWYVVESGISCYDLDAKYDITLDYFISLNTEVDTACDNLFAGYAYCVDGVPTNNVTVTASSSPTNVSQSISPTDISNSTEPAGVSQSTSSTGISASTSPASVSASTSTATVSSQTPSTASYVAAPTSTVTGTTSECYEWYIVESGNTCDTIDDLYGITLAYFLSLNTYIDASCDNLWVDTAYCVDGVAQ